MAETDCPLITKAKELFKTADSDNNGSLSRDELYIISKTLGFKMEQKEFTDWFADIDKDADAKITSDEFVGILSGRDPKDIKKAELRSAFNKLDADGSGKLTADEIRATVKSQDVSEEDSEATIKEADTDEDGKVSFEEFLKALKI